MKQIYLPIALHIKNTNLIMYLFFQEGPSDGDLILKVRFFVFVLSPKLHGLLTLVRAQ